MQANSQTAPALSVIKTSYEGDVRRFNLNSFDFDALKATIKQLYPDLAPVDFSVKFSDEDGDLITISSKAELESALTSAHAEGLKALKLYVSKAGAPAADYVEIASPPPSVPATPQAAAPAVAAAAPVTEAAQPQPPAELPAAPAVVPATSAISDEPESPKSAKDAQEPVNPWAGLSASSSAPAPAPDAKEEVKPDATENKPKPAAASPQCSYFQQLALAFVSDTKVQAMLPKVVAAVLDLVLPPTATGVERKDFTAQQLIDAALAFPEVKSHASVQALLPFLPFALGHLETHVKTVNRVLAGVDPLVLSVLKSLASSAPGMVERLAPKLPTILEQLFAQCAQQGGCGAFASAFKHNGDEVDIDLGALAGLLGPLAPLMGDIFGGAAPGAASAGPSGSPFPFFFRGSAAPAQDPSDLSGVFDVLRGFMNQEAPAAEAASASASSSSSSSSCSASAQFEEGTHPFVRCDGCNMTPIKGARFKCMRCPNFDLCEGCEAKNTHPANHPLMKLRPETVQPPVPSNVHEGITCDGCKVSPIVGVRYKCGKCPDFDLCESCEGKENAHPADHPLIKMREARTRGTGGRCGRFGGMFGGFGHHGPRPHHWGGHGGRAGGGCGAPGARGPFGGGGPFGGFRRFMHHLHEQNQAQANNGGTSASASSSSAEGKEMPRFHALFVRDVTIPDRSEVNAGSEHVKIWEMRNTGEVAWPQGTKLIFLRGDRELSAQEEFSVPAANPGQTAEVTAVIKAPSKAGRYAAYYRLADANRDVLFGPRVWVDVVVKEVKEAPAPTPTPVPAPVPTPAPAPAPKPADKKDEKAAEKPVVPGNTKFPAQMKVLFDMGFANSELNEFLLASNDGNVQKVAHFLLEKMYGQQ